MGKLAETWKAVAWADDVLENVVEDTTPQLGGDLDGQGYYATNLQNIPDLASKGPGYWFDGVDDYIEIADDADLDFGTGDFSILSIINSDNYAQGNQKIIDKHSGWAIGTIDAGFLFGAAVNKLNFELLDGGARNQSISPASSLTGDGTWHTVAAIRTEAFGGSVNLYIDGKDQVLTQPSGTNFDADVDNAIAMRIGYDGNATRCFKGQISLTLLFNLALTATEVKALSSGAPVPYKYIGASQTLIVPSDDCADDDTANWTDVNGALTDNGTEYTYTVTTGANVATFTDEAALTVGKRYRATVQAKDGTGAGSTVRINALTNADAVIENGTSITVEAGFTTATVEWTATETNNKVQIEIVAASVSDGETVLFDEIETNSIGCVLQLEQDGIGTTQWTDKSGNDLHGTVSGAIAINTQPKLTDDLEINEKTLLVIAALSTNLTWTGPTQSVTAGEILTIGEVAYLKSDGKYWLADADAEATADTKLVMATATIAADGTGIVLLPGPMSFMRVDATTEWTVTAAGDVMFLSTTEGELTNDISGYTTGDIVRVCGYMETAVILNFDVDKTFIEVA